LPLGSAWTASVAEAGLTVAVTGPTGTFGFGLIPLLQAEERVGRIVGIARRPFDPSEHGWSKMEYRRGDVRDAAALQEAFEGADVVVHLAFMITGTASRETIRAINVEGTLNAFRAAVACHVERFVYASSVAAYGFYPDNPIGMSEDWPVRPASRLFYAQEKAELEQLLQEEAAKAPPSGAADKSPKAPPSGAADKSNPSRGVALYLLRPPIVLGPHAVGAKNLLPEPLAALVQNALDFANRLPIPVPVPVPDLPMQFIHEDDVGQALLRCVLAAGPPGAYNIAGDGIVTAADVVRELGFTPITVPAGIAERVARAAASVPLPSFAPPAAGWVEAATHPAIMDTGKAKRELDWKPKYTGIEALRATLRREPS
jgi:nucleoside-diphosphate-sugar epimerase